MNPDFTAGLPSIQSERLSLRQLHRSDVGSLYRIFSDPTVTRYWGFDRLRGVDDAEKLFEEIEQGRCDNSLLQWGITLSGSDQVIGTATICWVPAHRRGELGFAIESARWGSGYGAEA